MNKDLSMGPIPSTSSVDAPSDILFTCYSICSVPFRLAALFFETS
jgi:hypothetical protein